jgi:hypothetical protein
MPMIPFMKRFPDLAARETRSVTVSGRTDIPDGDYGFLESICDEPGCDCRRVMIVVLRSDTASKRSGRRLTTEGKASSSTNDGAVLGQCPKLEGAIPGPSESSDSVFGGAAESVLFRAAITRLR